MTINKKRQVAHNALERLCEIFYGKIEEDKAPDCQTDKINDQLVVIRILVNEPNVHQDQDDINTADEADRSLAAVIDVSQPDKETII